MATFISVTFTHGTRFMCKSFSHRYLTIKGFSQMRRVTSLEVGREIIKYNNHVPPFVFCRYRTFWMGRELRYSNSKPGGGKLICFKLRYDIVFRVKILLI